MASTITNYTPNIDVQFPVPGADNDTAGFRTNFSNIRDGLTAAYNEITDIQLIQAGIINQLDSVTAPTAINATIVTATSVISQDISNAGTITANAIIASGDVSTNGYFIGDASKLTNIPRTDIANVGTLTNLEVTGLSQLGGTLLGNGNVTATTLTLAEKSIGISANNTLTITDVSQIALGNLKVLPKYYDNGVQNSALIALDYDNGKYQKVTVNTTGLTKTNFKVTNWPTSGNFSPLAVEVQFTGSPAGPIQTEFRSSCTTYGSTSTIVSIDDWLGTRFLGTAQLASGWAVYNTSTITTSTPVLTYINSVDNTRQISVFPGYNFVKGVSYYFTPPVGATLPYKIAITTSTGQTLKIEQNLAAEGIYNITDVVVAHLYSYDNGTTIFFNQLDIYNV